MSDRAVETKSNTEPTDVQFFAMPLKRLFILQLITGGLYELYWEYRNWKAIKQAERSNIYPLVFVIFGGIFIWPLYWRIARDARRRGYHGFTALLWLAFGIVATHLVDLVVSLTMSYGLTFGSGQVALMFVWALLPLLAQRAVNHGRSDLVDVAGRRPLSRGERIIVVLGVALWSMSLVSAFTPSRPVIDVAQSLKVLEQVIGAAELEAEYDECQIAVDQYNADPEVCEGIRLRQDAAIDALDKFLNE